MNEYKITYSYAEGATEIATIIERNESAARKDFKSHYKDGTILDVELSAEDVSATKQQERDTLEAIRKMVKELGPDSYVGTAFSGCFDLAEWNIEADAADNFAERIHHLDEIRLKAQGKSAAAEHENRQLKEQADELRARLAELEKKTLSADLYRNIWTLATSEAEASRMQMKNLADIMADFGDAPQDIAFKSAVENYRKEKQRAEHCERMVAALDAIEPEEV